MIIDKNRSFSFHIELSDYCNSNCVLCPRNELHKTAYNKNIVTLENFKKWFTKDIVKKTHRFTFVGNFGDPLTNKETPEIIRYIKQNNPMSVITLSSNASINDNDLFIRLSRVVDKNDEITFHIDGIGEEHEIYREGTSYDLIMKNAELMKSQNVPVIWGMIPFKHNEKRINYIRNNHKELGFKKFTIKPNWIGKDKYSGSVVNSKGIILEESTKKRYAVKYSEPQLPRNMSCITKKTNEIYVDSSGLIMPCCYFATYIRETYTNYFIDGNNDGMSNVDPFLKQWIDDRGGISKYSLYINTLDDILNMELFTEIEELFENEKTSFCAIRCATNREDNGYTYSKVCALNLQ
jgi:hypothetical protein